MDSELQGIDELHDHWIMYFDVLIPPEGDVLKYALQLEFLATNNITKYKGLVNVLRLAKDLGIR
jgi:hypothetical protein